MKKIGIILLAVVLFAAGSAYFVLRPSTTPADTSYADFLPQDTLALLSLRDINGLTDIFPKTAIGHFFSTATMERILVDLQAEARVIHDYAKSYNKLFAVLQNPAFRMIFGDDVDLAILSPDKDKISVDPEQALEESLVILATTSSSKAMETFARTLLHGDISTVKSGELDLTRVRLDEETYIYIYSQKSRLILARDPVAIERCVIAEDTGKTLQQESSFISAVQFWQGLSMTRVYSRGFVQLDRIQPYMLTSSDEDVKQIGHYLQGMQFIASAGGRNNEGWLTDSTSRYTYDDLDPAVRELVDSASAENFTLNLPGEESLLYSWSSTLSATSMLEALSATDADKYKVIDQRMQQEFGFSLEQVAGVFGPQYGILLKEIVQAGFFPLPKVVLFLQVKDHQVAKSFLARIRAKATSRGMASEQQEQVGEYTLYSWALLPGEATHLAVILTDDMLYFANGPSSLKQILKTEHDRFRLAESVVKKLGTELAAKVQVANNGALVIYPNRFAVQVKGAADWLAGMISASRGSSFTVLKDEILLVLQSTEVAVFISDLFQDHGDAHMIFKIKRDKDGV